ncbi:hypothetical protein DLR65_17980 [Vibrio tarriae]|nr:hypothetical protein DLR65_17980 [Vibrio tarriae]
MVLTKGQPTAVQICFRPICHSCSAYLQLQVVGGGVKFKLHQGLRVISQLRLVLFNHLVSSYLVMFRL